MMGSAKTFTTITTRKNETSYPFFVAICKMSATVLKHYLDKVLRGFYSEVINEDGFLYAKGTIPVLLTAHMDTVHAKLVKDYYEHKTPEGKTIISSPQGIGGDDRCGIYMILQILRSTEMRPSILFCEDEEKGGIGSDKFCKSKYIEDLKSMNFLIELDRANAFDAVFYEDDNFDFHDWISVETGYKEEWGTFSDISNLSPACGIASVNLSCGYYNAHTTNEFVVIEEMQHTIETVKHLLKTETEPFKYVESYYNSLYDNRNWISSKLFPKKYDMVFEVYFIDPTTKKETVWSKEVTSENQGWTEFFFSNMNVCMGDVTDYDFYEIY